MPRDRNGTFESQLVKKRERRLAGFDDRILALYTRHAENALTDFDEKWRRRYPSDEAAVKLLYLALRNLEKRWGRSIRAWTKSLGQVRELLPGRRPQAPSSLIPNRLNPNRLSRLGSSYTEDRTLPHLPGTRVVDFA